MTAHDFKGCDEGIGSSALVCIVASLLCERKAGGRKWQKRSVVAGIFTKRKFRILFLLIYAEISVFFMQNRHNLLIVVTLKQPNLWDRASVAIRCAAMAAIYECTTEGAVMLKYDFSVKTREGQKLESIVIAGIDREHAERKLRQMYRHCDILRCEIKNGGPRLGHRVTADTLTANSRFNPV